MRGGCSRYLRPPATRQSSQPPRNAPAGPRTSCASHLCTKEPPAQPLYRCHCSAALCRACRSKRSLRGPNRAKVSRANGMAASDPLLRGPRNALAWPLPLLARPPRPQCAARTTYAAALGWCRVTPHAGNGRPTRNARPSEPACHQRTASPGLRPTAGRRLRQPRAGPRQAVASCFKATKLVHRCVVAQRVERSPAMLTIANAVHLAGAAGFLCRSAALSNASLHFCPALRSDLENSSQRPRSWTSRSWGLRGTGASNCPKASGDVEGCKKETCRSLESCGKLRTRVMHSAQPSCSRFQQRTGR